MALRTKTCSDCHRTLSLTEFYPRGDRGKGLAAYSTYCKPCHLERGKRYRVENPEKCKAKERRYYQKVKGEARTKQSLLWLLKVKYGITLDDYNRMLAVQGGVCAICKNPPNGHGNAGRRLHVDHDHQTKRIRGLLCTSCNQGLGYFDEQAERLNRAAEYLTGERPSQ